MNEAFFAAARDGDAERVRAWLAEDSRAVEWRDAEQATALHYAARHGHRELIDILLEAGADVNARDGRFGATPSDWAVEHLRGLGGLLSIELDDFLAAIKCLDVRFVRRQLERFPALATASDERGKLFSDYARDSRNGELISTFLQSLSPGEQARELTSLVIEAAELDEEDELFTLAAADGLSEAERSARSRTYPAVSPSALPVGRMQFGLGTMMAVTFFIAIGMSGQSWMPPAIFAGLVGGFVVVTLVWSSANPPETRAGRICFWGLQLAYVAALVATFFRGLDR